MATAITRTYGPDGRGFLLALNPSVQAQAAANPLRCYTSQAPTLAAAARVWGSHIPIAWLQAQLRDLATYAGSLDKLTAEQSRGAAEAILAGYPSLRASELLLFFARFKAGRYGRFYGPVDPLAITTGLRDFVRQRATEIAQLELQAAQADREAPRSGTVTRDQYLALKRRAEAGDPVAIEALKPPKSE